MFALKLYSNEWEGKNEKQKSKKKKRKRKGNRYGNYEFDFIYVVF